MCIFIKIAKIATKFSTEGFKVFLLNEKSNFVLSHINLKQSISAQIGSMFQRHYIRYPPSSSCELLTDFLHIFYLETR